MTKMNENLLLCKAGAGYGDPRYGDDWWQQLNRAESDESDEEVTSMFYGEDKKGQPFCVNSEQEEEIVAWLRACPCFFHKTDPDYYTLGTKDPLMRLQVRKMELTFAAVSSWCKSMQERHALLVWQDKNSPLWRYSRSARDVWILSHFSFINESDESDTPPREKIL